MSERELDDEKIFNKIIRLLKEEEEHIKKLIKDIEKSNGEIQEILKVINETVSLN